MANATSAEVRREIETHLASRIPAALSPLAVQPPRLLPCGIAEIEKLLGGGFPVGGISEFTGVESSGRSSIAFSILSEATAKSACAYVDASDTFDPQSAAASGVRLQNLLWVRLVSEVQPFTQPIEPLTLLKSASGAGSESQSEHRGGSHPMAEVRKLDRAVEKMFVQKTEARLKKAEGTPGHPNQKLSLVSAPKDQVAYEHFNARRADESDPLRRLDRQAADTARKRTLMPLTAPNPTGGREKPWTRLEKAIRVADLILQSGGFRVVVLDLASVPAEQALRIPSATWFRFRRAAQEGDAVMLLLTSEPCARSSAACVIECSADAASCGQSSTFIGNRYYVEIARQRTANPYGKKTPGRAATWEALAPWMRAVGR